MTVEQQRNEVYRLGYELAMRVLQSDLYGDPETRQLVDDIILLTSGMKL